MDPLHSNNTVLREFAAFVRDKSGPVIITKALEVLANIEQNRATYFEDKEQLARMEYDVKFISYKILHTRGLWSEQEKQERLPQKLQQILASMANLLTVRTLLLSKVWAYYHRDLLATAVVAVDPANVDLRKFVRDYAETLLKQAYQEDHKPHYLLRDPTSLTNKHGVEKIVCSCIMPDGTVSHRAFTYAQYKDAFVWTDDESLKCSKSMLSLIKALLPDAIPVTYSPERATKFSYSYSIV